MEDYLKFLKKHLQGRTIKEVRYTSKDEMEEAGWSRSGIILVLDDGKEVLVTSDEEGNGPGDLWV